ncbi:Methylthioribose-1-phosphate isomerase [Candidatus Methylobacter favarea]|uniref:Methylthioribose-1-phosphate isomerase n=1 Tax=Candidatus Methylobacter favarea TaxID=2707345 RepID=A0A8S0WPP6_9GAMM|nr:S-methyl-5-thioribose-1-phosphate isomerase [Candidatus Methylobacter favarea]CAA9891025.1 Methylthioribose-1-phosphate isomerase [Candidatus Methylobacter favarea]
MTMQNNLTVQALQWTGDTLRVLDQRQLPEQTIYDEYSDAAGVAKAIATMRVRGAPAIGIAAAYGAALSARRHYGAADWRQRVMDDIELLAQSRPTAVNLFWALDRMKTVLNQQLEQPLAAISACAEKIHADDIAANYAMGELGADIITGARGVMTHCNTGALATGGYGTALGVIRSMYRRNHIKVYAGETRPWLQGMRLTVWELAQESIPVTLVADSAAAWLMKSGAIDWIIVGADRIAANGDTANKIGTYSLAVLAKQHGVKLMVAAPTSTIDWKTSCGDQIEIEQRHQNELLAACYLKEGSVVSAWNPVFDVTPAELISAIVTERGAVLHPSEQSLRILKNESE